MELRGDLADRGVVAVLAEIARSGRTGKLRLSQRDGEAAVLFDQGRVHYAATRGGRETFGSILVARRAITPKQLDNALGLQRSLGGKSLGSVLIDLHVVSRQEVDEAVREQISQVLSELITWQQGRYEFEPLSLSSAQYTSLPLEEVLPAAREVVTRNETAEAPETEALPEPPREHHLDLLKRISASIQSPELTGELVTRILEAATNTVDRAVLFRVRPDGFQALSQIGLEGPEAEASRRVRRLFVASELPSILRAATDENSSVCRTLDPDGADQALVEALGGEVEGQAVVVPITTTGKVMALLYGDNQSSGRPIEDVAELELAMLDAGIEMENSLLDKRRAHYDDLRESSGVEIEGQEAGT